ncbi:Alpha/beta hydrolase family protein [Pseudoxanthomonas sp. CF385]|uniref:alpha/beta fold hydrolase n=1 Tax=Pseudoxanthomonas sp. CF385 TaxID=1881042 RepID=UPI000885E477|nr:alpha/beta fold hydrolase [Pseudoxanthomonas sp. CF385]SDQ95090.1 Alpha/beta hydrolase family protein [Pseudoxanthomonas sp. CF385]
MTATRAALLVHGAGGGGWEWNLWRGVFEAAGYRVEAPDLMPAPAGLSATRFGDYQAQVGDALAALPRPRVLVGASLGGLLALGAAADVDAMVLVNPLPPAPWHADMPARDWPEVVHWRRDARLTGTRRAMPDADDATALFAFRHWRDESGAVLREAQRGVAVARPACPVLCMVSDQDDDVPPAITRAMAEAWGADVLQTLSASHVGPLLGRDAAGIAAQAVEWLNRAVKPG